MNPDPDPNPDPNPNPNPNPNQAVVALKTELEGKVFVIDCMVDRVCTGRSITEDGVDVSAEPWKVWAGF
eukprot:scaffold55947_cov45-Phaeocystis_antarctica.AAC.1